MESPLNLFTIHVRCTSSTMQTCINVLLIYIYFNIGRVLDKSFREMILSQTIYFKTRLSLLLANTKVIYGLIIKSQRKCSIFALSLVVLDNIYSELRRLPVG